jgi:signal transduction histidine kinase
MPQSAEPRSTAYVTPPLSTWWWAPSVAVILVLLALLIVPAAIDRRVATHRDAVVIGEHARALVNDLEASLANELLVRSAAGSANKDSIVLASRRRLDSDAVDLRSAMTAIGPPAVSLYGQLEVMLKAWDSSTHDGAPIASRDGLDLLDVAERVDAYLTSFVQRERDEAAHVARYYVLIPTVLAPISLLAMALTLWSGYRVLRFARSADEERAAVTRAADARTSLLRGVTHDVKNPLGAAAGYAQLLEEGIVGPLTPQQNDMVRRIQRLVGQSVQTVTDLLELARAEGSLHVEYVTTDLAGLLTEVADDHRGAAQEAGLTMTIDAPPTPIVTDPVRVQQVLANLFSNAIKYTPSGGRIQASIVRAAPGSDAAGRIGVAIQDTGPGVPAELQSRLFEEFFRVSATAATADGNGLGLAISRRIARLLGGDVRYASAPGGGSVFTVWLPGAPAAVDSRAES